MSEKNPNRLTRSYRKFVEWLKTPNSKPRHEWHGFVLNPFVQALYWFFTFLLAAAASLWANEIRPSEKTTAPLDSTDITGTSSTGSGEVSDGSFIIDAWGGLIEFVSSFTSEGYVFFALTILSAAVFAYTAWVKSLRETYLFHTMQTNPPQGFWARFEEAVKATRATYTKVQTTVFKTEVTQKDILDCEEGVRTILDHVINLVMAWDTANIERKVIYRANVMDVVHFKDHPSYTLGQDVTLPDGAKQDEREAMLHSLERFLIQPIHSHYSGVIALNDNRYTTTTETKDSSPDSSIKPIAFPFCLSDETCSHKFHTNMRGAPFCVATDAPDTVENVVQIIDYYKNHADPKSKKIQSNLKDYYLRKGFPAQSILSIPLRIRTENDEPQVRWVLNIYRNQPGMLYNQEKNKQFSQIISSLTTQLEVILDMLEGVNITEESEQINDTSKSVQSGDCHEKSAQ